LNANCARGVHGEDIPIPIFLLKSSTARKDRHADNRNSCFSLIRASSVVKRRSALMRCLLRLSCHAATSSINFDLSRKPVFLAGDQHDDFIEMPFVSSMR